jgi:hypothetical protein
VGKVLELEGGTGTAGVTKGTNADALSTASAYGEILTKNSGGMPANGHTNTDFCSRDNFKIIGSSRNPLWHKHYIFPGCELPHRSKQQQRHCFTHGSESVSSDDASAKALLFE